MFCFDEVINGIHFQVGFVDKVNLLFDNSATGKTYLMKVIQGKCMKTGISCKYVNSARYEDTEESIIQFCKNSNVVLFDNADLYLTKTILENIVKTADCIIVCAKSSGIVRSVGGRLYHVLFSSKTLTVKRIMGF